MQRRSFLAVGISSAMLVACKYERTFSIEWDEQIKLCNGTITVVHIKNLYERLDRSKKYDSAILRESTISFRTLTGQRVEQHFIRQRPMLLVNVEDKWLLVIEQLGGMTGEEAGQSWGWDVNGYGQRVVILKGKEFVPGHFSDLPSNCTTPNFLLTVPSIAELAEINNTQVTIEQKLRILQKYPPDPTHKAVLKPFRTTK